MSEQDFSDDESLEIKSKLACHTCRRRKIKCDRELPQCSLCKQLVQQCCYPDKVLKPGPKIGSTQMPRKRKIQNDNDTASRDRRPSTARRASQQAHPDEHDCASQFSPGVSAGNQSSPVRRPANMQSLSFIIHPSHDSCSPEKVSESPGSSRQAYQQSHVAASCCLLSLNPQYLNETVDQFFENFTSFQLFCRSEFIPMLHQIETTAQCTALLAAVVIFATKSCSQPESDSVDRPLTGTTSSSYQTVQALKYIDQAIHECEDESISLPLLQALVLVTHWLLVQGVRGRAWRYLDPEQWREKEKRRRVWWAIWEMDVFASVIRRCPTAICWSQNETFLPVEDEKWISGTPQKSSTLKLDTIERYKALEASGNLSPKAWFIVINSFMKDAQGITSPIGVDQTSETIDQRASIRSSVHLDGADAEAQRRTLSQTELTNRLKTIQNALQCTIMALPSNISYKNQFLCFGSKELDRAHAATLRLRHSSVYSIHMMVQLTKLMIHKYYIFRSGADSIPIRKLSADRLKNARYLVAAQALDQYSEAAGEITVLVGRSYEDHHRYVNPFLANTIWLAGAVQLVYKEFASLQASDKDLTNSRLELLSMTYNRFVTYWSMSPTLKKNLEVVKSEIEILKAEVQDSARSSISNRLIERPPPAKRRPSKKDTRIDTETTQRPAGPDHEVSHCRVTADVYAERSAHMSKNAGNEVHSIWQPFNTLNGSDDHQFTNIVDFGPSYSDLLSDASNTQQTQHNQIQQLSHSSEANYVDMSTASSSMQQIPIAAHTLTQHELSRQSGHLQADYDAPLPSIGLSPDFLAGISFAQKSYLSNYLGDMLSGG